MSKICVKCKQPIVGSAVSTLHGSYHPHHFVCEICKNRLDAAEYRELSGKIYCVKDFQAFLPRCALCHKPIADKLFKALNRDWHAEHFVCSLCKAPLQGRNFFTNSKGDPLCESCMVQSSPKCVRCGQPVGDKAIMALEQFWHRECFLCAWCKLSIVEGFVVVKGELICFMCNKSHRR